MVSADNMPDMAETFTDRLRKAMRAREIGPVALDAALDKKLGYVSTLLGREGTPKVDSAAAIAKALGVRLDQPTSSETRHKTFKDLPGWLDAEATARARYRKIPEVAWVASCESMHGRDGHPDPWRYAVAYMHPPKFAYPLITLSVDIRVVLMTSPLPSSEAAALLARASERLQSFPTSTLLLAVLACAGDDTLTVREVDEVLLARGSHDLMGAEAVEEIEAILAQSATVPAPAPTEEDPEAHLRLALEHLEKAIKGFGPGPSTYALEYNALDLRGALAALDVARSLKAEAA